MTATTAALIDRESPTILLIGSDDDDMMCHDDNGAHWNGISKSLQIQGTVALESPVQTLSFDGAYQRFFATRNKARGTAVLQIEMDGSEKELFRCKDPVTGDPVTGPVTSIQHSGNAGALFMLCPSCTNANLWEASILRTETFLLLLCLCLCLCLCLYLCLCLCLSPPPLSLPLSLISVSLCLSPSPPPPPPNLVVPFVLPSSLMRVPSPSASLLSEGCAHH